MFDFNKSEEGSEERFANRIEIFKDQNIPLPKIRHYGWWWLHNCVSHPLIGFFPINIFFRFHDWTSIKLNGR